MFEIKLERLGRFTQIKILNSTTGEFLSFLPEIGGAINGLTLQKNGKLISLLYTSLKKATLLSDREKQFKGSKLFPFPNRVCDGIYIWHGKTYRLPINFPSEGHTIHGLVLTAKFKIMDKKISSDSAMVKIEYDYDGSYPGYPFKFKLYLTYTLTKSAGVIFKTVAENTDKTEIPVGDGWHPYFQTGSKVDELEIEIPSDQIIEVNQRMIPTGKIIHSDEYSRKVHIQNHHFDVCYKVTESYKGKAYTEISDPARKITLTVWQETGKNKYNYLQIHTPLDRRSIAIEPITCIPDAFNNKMGLVILKPNDTITLEFGIKV